MLRFDDRHQASGTGWLASVAVRFAGPIDAVNFDRSEIWSLLDGLPVAILVAWGRDCSRITGNIAAHAMLRVPRGGNMSQSAGADEAPPFKIVRDGTVVPAHDLPMQRCAATGQQVVGSECEVVFDDGRRLHLVGHCVPIRDAGGEVCGSIGAFIDVTFRIEELGRAETIASEMSHRVTNSFALVQSMAKMTIAKELEDETYATFEDRLHSIARYQKLASRAEWQAIELARLCENSVIPAVGSASDRVRFEGEAIDVDAGAAFSLGMLLHELTTNSCKYGSLSAPTGELVVSWTVQSRADNRRICLLWSEVNGPQVSAPVREGFGSRLVRTLARSLPQGKIDIDYAADGLKARLDFDLSYENG